MLFTLLFAATIGVAQVNIIDMGNGRYGYQSLYNQSDLSFYLYGDGYHSFDPNNIHQYGNNLDAISVKLFHSEPYDHDDPDELGLHIVTNGVDDPDIVDVPLGNKVELKTSWNLVNGSENYYILMFENNEENVISGCIEFHFDSAKSFVNEPGVLDDYSNNWVDNRTPEESEYSEYTHKYKWEFDDLQVDEQRFIYIPVACLGQVAETVSTLAIMKTDCLEKLNLEKSKDGNNEGVTDSDYFTLYSFVSTNPHDPNCIVTESECLVKKATQVVRYRIYFQNDGSEPATIVKLDYHINYPFTNVTLVEASHSCKLAWQPDPDGINESGTIEIDYENIYLPGTGTIPAPRYEETIGWVDIDVCYANTLMEDPALCADNSVDIYFNDEAPVTAYHSLCKKPGCAGNHGNNVNGSTNVCDSEVIGRQSFIASDHHSGHGYFIQPGSVPARTGNNELRKENVELTSLDKAKKVLVYPNPVLDIINLEIPDALMNANMTIHSSMGEVVLSKITKENKMTLDVSTLNNGVYYISIINGSETKINSFVKI